jgi:hypothetical protein
MKVMEALVVGGGIGVLFAAACGATVGEFFELPAIEAPPPRRPPGAVWGSVFFVSVFGLPAAAVCGVVGACWAWLRNSRRRKGQSPRSRTEHLPPPPC